MSRVPCLDCGIPVVVDPSGLCPDGHLVGTAGARIEQAIGADVPHPDEPEPWVGHVELHDELPDPTLPSAAPARTIRPVEAPGAPHPAPVAEEEPDHEELLRELQSLSSLGGGSAPAPEGPPPPSPVPQVHAEPVPVVAKAPPAPPQVAPPVPAPAPPTAVPTARPVAVAATPPDVLADGLAEFSALEAAVQALETGRTDTRSPSGPDTAEHPDPAGPPTAPATAAAATSGDDTLGALDALFAGTGSGPSATARVGTSTPSRPAAARHLHLAPTTTAEPLAVPTAAVPTAAAPTAAPSNRAVDPARPAVTPPPPAVSPRPSAATPSVPAADLPTPVAELPAPATELSTSTTALPASPTELPTPATDHPAPAPDAGPTLDLTSFTARGNRVADGKGGRAAKGGKRRLFGR